MHVSPSKPDNLSADLMNIGRFLNYTHKCQEAGGCPVDLEFIFLYLDKGQLYNNSISLNYKKNYGRLWF